MDEQRCVHSSEKDMEEIFFTYISNKITCLLCSFQPSFVRKYNCRRHYQEKHYNNYSKYVDEEKLNLIEGLKLIHQKGCSSISHINNATSSVKALTTSYAISDLIAKNSKSFSEEKFIKKCIIVEVESFGNLLTREEAFL